MIHLADRSNLITEQCRGKTVLDVGSTGQTDAYDLWDEITAVARDVIGIDVISHGNPDIITGNMETHEFGQKFDVIIAGDVIEHVMNQGLFLQNIKRHLETDGRLILTTPNAKWPTVFLKPNPTHTAWHDKYTLSYLVRENGFFIETFAYYLGNKSYPFLLRPIVWRQGLLVVCALQGREV